MQIEMFIRAMSLKHISCALFRITFENKINTVQKVMDM